MNMIEIMKRLGIKKAEWVEQYSSFDGSWLNTYKLGVYDWETHKYIKEYKKFDERTDRKYMKDFGTYHEYRFFDERKHDKLVENGWKPVHDNEYQPVRVHKEYFVNGNGEIFRLRKSLNCTCPIIVLEQMVIGKNKVKKNDYINN